MASAGQFPDTRWTLIQKAGHDEHSLQEWCLGYWLPVRNYICAQGRTLDDANDLTQAFFEKLLAKERTDMLPTELSGAFRAYLRRSIKNFLHDDWRSLQSKRKGGGEVPVEIDDERLPDPGDSAEMAFDRAWVLTVIDHAVDAVKREMTKAGKGILFDSLVRFIDGRDPDRPHKEVAEEFGMTEGTLRVALYRMRQRFRFHIEEELRQTVSSKSELDEEIGNLLAIWS